MAEGETALKPQRVVVLLRPADKGRGPGTGLLSHKLIWAGAAFVLLAGLAIGFRSAALLLQPEETVTAESARSTTRVQGGLYALELATPRGQSRWMLEFDAEIVTSDGPKNPLEMRNALEDLVITATSMPLVQTADDPEAMMREAMLAVAAQDYPWLIDLYMTRSDIRASNNRLDGIGRAMRELYER